MVTIALLVAWLAPLLWLFAAAERAIAAADVGPPDPSQADDRMQGKPVTSVTLIHSEPADSATSLELDQPGTVPDALFKWATPRVSRKQNRLRQVA